MPEQAVSLPKQHWMPGAQRDFTWRADRDYVAQALALPRKLDALLECPGVDLLVVV